MITADPLYTSALASLEVSVGPSHPEVATVLKGKAQLYSKTNRQAEAKVLTERAEKIMAIKR